MAQGEVAGHGKTGRQTNSNKRHKIQAEDPPPPQNPMFLLYIPSPSPLTPHLTRAFPEGVAPQLLHHLVDERLQPMATTAHYLGSVIVHLNPLLEI